MNIKLFLKGMLMGICDTIPGISGGTIAFITGIYEKLIDSVNQVFELKDLKNFKKNFKKIDFKFLITLFLGIFTAIILGSRIITYLLENYFNYTIAFFIGLILASSKIIYKNIEEHKYYYFGIAGFLVGIILAIVTPASPTITLPYVFIGGIIAISAMFLPGISGAFILLIMGLYEYIIKALHDREIITLAVFLIGAIIGAFIISKIIHYLFKKSKQKILYTLLGLVIGSIAVPIRKIIINTNEFSLISLFIMIGLIIIGIIIVYFVDNKSLNNFNN